MSAVDTSLIPTSQLSADGKALIVGNVVITFEIKGGKTMLGMRLPTREIMFAVVNRINHLRSEQNRVQKKAEQLEALFMALCYALVGQGPVCLEKVMEFAKHLADNIDAPLPAKLQFAKNLKYEDIGKEVYVHKPGKNFFTLSFDQPPAKSSAESSADLSADSSVDKPEDNSGDGTTPTSTDELKKKGEPWE